MDNVLHNVAYTTSQYIVAVSSSRPYVARALAASQLHQCCSPKATAHGMCVLGTPSSRTVMESPCSVRGAATVLSTRARAALHQHCLRASQAAAATLTTRTRASLARIRDNNRRAALPGPRASVVNTTLTAAPSGSSASCSPTTSAAFPRAQPLKSSSPPADQAAATTLSAFARAAPARTGYISQTAALPSCPRADNQASNFKFTAAPKDATASRIETTYAGPPRAAPPGTSCKPSLRPASKPFSPGLLPTPLPQPRPGILPDPPLSHRLTPYPLRVAMTTPAPAVNHAALLYFLHLQGAYIRVLSDIFLRASLLPSAS